MSKVQIPKKKRRNQLPEPPKVQEAKSHNISKAVPGQKAQIHFDVAPEEKRELRLLAAEFDTKMINIFREALQLWKEKHGRA